MLFGWGFWVWSIPVILLLGYFWHLVRRSSSREVTPAPIG
jgi:hypothetical protein